MESRGVKQNDRNAQKTFGIGFDLSLVKMQEEAVKVEM